MFVHRHPYPPFIPKNATKLIVGTIPPPRFTVGKLFEKDVDFSYGSYYNSLWLYIDAIHNLNFRYDNSEAAIVQRKNFLITHKIGICDIVERAEREHINASDLGLKKIVLRNIIAYLQQFKTVNTLLFIGGASKNGPEYFFRKQLKEHKIQLHTLQQNVPRIHQFTLPKVSALERARSIITVSLTSSSGSANRAIGSMALYKKLKQKNPNFTTFDFRVMQYRDFF